MGWRLENVGRHTRQIQIDQKGAVSFASGGSAWVQVNITFTHTHQRLEHQTGFHLIANKRIRTSTGITENEDTGKSLTPVTAAANRSMRRISGKITGLWQRRYFTLNFTGDRVTLLYWRERNTLIWV
jgi:hypothetical protein